MPALSDIDIRNMIDSGELKIQNFSESCLAPASYDLRLGVFVYKSSDKEPRKLSDGDILVLEPNEFVLVTTYEVIELPTYLIGQVGLRSRFSLSGLLNISGIQVDPGFHGRLVLGMINLSQKTRKIAFLERIFTIQFYRLSSRSSKAYEGLFHNINGIPAEFVERLQASEGPTQHQLIQKVEKLENQVKILFGSLSVMVPILVAFIIFILDKIVR